MYIASQFNFGISGYGISDSTCYLRDREEVEKIGRFGIDEWRSFTFFTFSVLPSKLVGDWL